MPYKSRIGMNLTSPPTYGEFSTSFILFRAMFITSWPYMPWRSSKCLMLLFRPVALSCLYTSCRVYMFESVLAPMI